jgi:glycosyltransferase involved in cell wall biosynthesis
VGRPTVLHCAQRWVNPSEGFVLDTVRSTTATRAVAACQERVPDAPAPSSVRVHDLGRLLRRLPAHAEGRALPVLLALAAVRERADLFHCHFGYWAVPVARAARRLGKPWVLSLHGDDLLALPGRQPEVLDAYRQADLVVVPSHWLAERAVSAGIATQRLRVIPSGVDLSRLTFRERGAGERVTVTFAGRFVPKKGVLDAARALSLAAREIPDLHAVFVGHGPLEGELREALAGGEVSWEVRDGRVSGAVRAALDATDLALTASRVAADGDAETLGLVNVEALCLGAPLVTTRSGGIPEYVPDGDPLDAGAPALLANEGDVQGLAAHLVRLARSPETWAARGRAGRAHVAQLLELGARTADLEAQYLSLVSRGTPADGPAVVRTHRPSASVVMVTHDRRDLLVRALDALDAQTVPPEEVIVVDNGCSDGSSELLAARVGPGFVVVRNDHNAPPAIARNQAAALATGEVLAFTDDDCRPTPTWLEALLSGMREGVAIVQGRTTADPTQVVEPLSRTQWTPSEYGLYETANIAYDAGAFHAVGGFDEQLAAEVARVLGRRFGRYPFGEDTDLAWRVRRNGGLTRFSAHAVVHHHVFPPDPPYLLRRAVLAAGFPLLMRRIPELREGLLTAGFVLGRHRLMLLVAFVGLALAAWQPWSLTLCVPYVWRLLRPLAGGRRGRIKAAPVLVARDLVETVALVTGSVRARSLVL